ncbi:uclacyanin 1-like [Punica granatum]|uniref:Phytocyanin domain-containing protein n=2 Tax=Punica granatum TaxID=22663 RepID=A0A218X5R1_PUNGR|nr:uclacyanin 1-like [Punica granatum]OWM79841.1 hypothetical protein CDL15_Pgr023253 [Punica granatum]PKI42382.1 hypothetical protein CRG98_037224 [Punica granatum]
MKGTIMISLVVVALLIRLSSAVDHTVGGPNGGWDTSSDLKSWASSNTFAVGDSLVFQYLANHDVTEVPKVDYDSCQAANPIGTYTGGSTVISLTSPGKRYFICAQSGHCDQGMKLETDTTTASSSPPPESPAIPPPPESPVTPPPQSKAPAPRPQVSSSPKSSPAPNASPSLAPALAPPKSSPAPNASPSLTPASAPVPNASPSLTPASAPPPTATVAQSPTSSANKGTFGFITGLAWCTGVMIFLAL